MWPPFELQVPLKEVLNTHLFDFEKAAQVGPPEPHFQKVAAPMYRIWQTFVAIGSNAV